MTIASVYATTLFLQLESRLKQREGSKDVRVTLNSSRYASARSQ